MTLRERFDRWFDAEGSYRALEWLRIALGPLVLAHLAPFFAAMSRGESYADSFYVPWFPGYPELPEPAYFALLALAAGLAVLVSLGVFTRLSLPLLTALVAYNLFLSETHYHHNRAFLLAILLSASLMPLGRSRSIDAILANRVGRAVPEVAPLWPLHTMRALVVAPYLASGFSKLVDPDWWGGVVTWDRVLRFHDVALAQGVPPWALSIASEPRFHFVFAKAAVVTELAIGVGVLVPRTRRAAVVLALLFHGGIQLLLDVQVFSLLGLAVQLVWIDPKPRDPAR